MTMMPPFLELRSIFIIGVYIMPFADNILTQGRPDSIRCNVVLPRRQHYHPSPADWRDEVLYFLLVDRFSDEVSRPLLGRRNLRAARPRLPNGQDWRWDRWAASGADRWQGGTIRGSSPGWLT